MFRVSKYLRKCGQVDRSPASTLSRRPMPLAVALIFCQVHFLPQVLLPLASLGTRHRGCRSIWAATGRPEQLLEEHRSERSRKPDMYAHAPLCSWKIHDWKMTDRMAEMEKRQDRAEKPLTFDGFSARSCRSPGSTIRSVSFRSCISALSSSYSASRLIATRSIHRIHHSSRIRLPVASTRRDSDRTARYVVISSCRLKRRSPFVRKPDAAPPTPRLNSIIRRRRRRGCQPGLLGSVPCSLQGCVEAGQRAGRQALSVAVDLQLPASVPVSKFDAVLLQCAGPGVLFTHMSRCLVVASRQQQVTVTRLCTY